MRLPKLYKKVFDAIYEQFPIRFGEDVIPRLNQSDVNPGDVLGAMQDDAWRNILEGSEKEDYSKWVMLTPEYVSEWFANND